MQKTVILYRSDEIGREERAWGKSHQGENHYLMGPSRDLKLEKFLTDPFQLSIMDTDLSL